MSSAMGKKNSFSTIMNSIFNGRLYCCIVTDASGETLISETCKIGYSVNAENALASWIKAKWGLAPVRLKDEGDRDSGTFIGYVA